MWKIVEAWKRDIQFQKTPNANDDCGCKLLNTNKIQTSFTVTSDGCCERFTNLHSNRPQDLLC